MKKITPLILFLVVVSSLGAAVTIHIPDDYPTIQAGIDAAVNGDTVWVAPGTYVENINFLGKAISVISVDGAGSTVIDGGEPPNPDLGSVVTLSHGEGVDSILEGFTITNGTGSRSALYLLHFGGGIFIENSSPTIAHNIVVDNSALFGGGIFCGYDASPSIMNNTITSNSAYYDGGGIYSYDSCPTIENNNFSGNRAGMGGGGIFSEGGDPLIRKNVICGNEALWSGGGIECHECNSPTIGNNTIIRNLAGSDGGGIKCRLSSSIIMGNHIGWNRATSSGGGIGCDLSSSTLVNNMIVGNRGRSGGGIYIWHDSTPIITNNTIMSNSAKRGGGIVCVTSFAKPIVTNSILWGNEAQYGSEISVGNGTYTSSLTISHSVVEGGQSSVMITPSSVLNWGSGMIDADPLFADPMDGDFHLTYNSPCRGAGDNAALGLPGVDFEGDIRVYQSTVDIGADEFCTHLYCTGDFSPNTDIEGKFVGLPATTPVGLLIGSGIMNTPLQHKWGEFHLESPWLFFPLAPIAPDGILVISDRLPATPAPYDIYMQALIGWELSNLFVLEVR